MPLAADYRNVRAVRTRKNRKRNLSAVYKQTWNGPATLDANGLSVSHNGAASAGTTNMTLGGALGGSMGAYSRNVVITVTHASAVVAMSGTITGTDQFGNTITEAWSVTTGGTSKTFTGKKAFSTVTQITEVVAADASANSIVAGSGVVFGLELPASSIVIVAEEEDGAVPTAGVLVAASSASTADRYGTYAPNSAPNGSLVFVVYYLVDAPELAAD